jgi:TPR repeat protein
MYDAGRGVPQDDAAAASWYLKAADHGHACAQCNLGFIYETGQGVPKDYAAAASWYRKAADHSRADAQSKLRDMYGNGLGVPQNYAVAMDWYRKAADQGSNIAKFTLGNMYLGGMAGLPEDLVNAHMWFNLAAACGNEVAAKIRDSIAATMTPAQIAEAQRRAVEWRPKVPNATPMPSPPDNPQRGTISPR